MYQYIWDEETGGPLLIAEQSKFSKEPRPVYYQELDILGFDKYWNYPKDDSAPLLWAEANNYIYKGRTVARAKGGAIYAPPEIEILEEPEVNGGALQFVNVDRMVEKNAPIMEALIQETIRNAYNTYRKYKNRVDIFYVAFSGGKDSIVTLDIIQRALPHEDFAVLFGDTQMEFSDTYEIVEKVKEKCENAGIRFYTSRSEYTPMETWSKFGPPATVTRWCCSVHKTAPQIILLRKILNKPDFTGMAFVGVRADESLARSKYDDVTFGGKHKGQYSYNAILDWNSLEVFLYIYQEKLPINDAYKKGNRRAGCLICPRAAERSDFMNHHCYINEAEPLVDSIRNSYKGTFANNTSLEEFIANGGWKARKNGRDLAIPLNYTEKSSEQGDTIITINHPKTDWHVWIKTVGVLVNGESPYTVEYQKKIFQFELLEKDDTIVVRIEKNTVKEAPEFVKGIKEVFRKVACCIGCRVCQADCPHGYLNFVDGRVCIDDRCHHCAQCHKVEKGCLVYKSLERPKGGIVVGGKNMSLNSYSHHAPKMDWMLQYFAYKNDFDENHTLGSQMYGFFKRFLRDAQLLDSTGFSNTAQIIDSIGIESVSAWGIILSNLCYTPQVGWFVRKMSFNEEYSKQFLANAMIDAGAKETWTNDIFSSLCRLCELPLGEIGLGTVCKDKNRASAIIRRSWAEPDTKVILYSLYLFAEKCGDYYQFTLSELLDDSIERDGISPTRIFGLDYDTMVPILNGLSANYPDFISASFSLGLDTISLRPDKSAQDVLNLF